MREILVPAEVQETIQFARENIDVIKKAIDGLDNLRTLGITSSYLDFSGIKTVHSSVLENNEHIMILGVKCPIEIGDAPDAARNHAYRLNKECKNKGNLFNLSVDYMKNELWVSNFNHDEKKQKSKLYTDIARDAAFQTNVDFGHVNGIIGNIKESESNLLFDAISSLKTANYQNVKLSLRLTKSLFKEKHSNRSVMRAVSGEARHIDDNYFVTCKPGYPEFYSYIDYRNDWKIDDIKVLKSK